LEFHVVHTAISNFLRRENGDISTNNNLPYRLLFNNKNCIKAKDFRLCIVDAKYTTPCATRFWLNKFNTVVNDKTWKIAYNATKESRLRELQWKILHNIYPTNILLLKIGEAQNNRCSLCNTEVDYIEHFFFECQKICTLWSHITEIICRNLSLKINLTAEIVLLGLQNGIEFNLTKTQTKYVNHLILVGKMCISKFRYGKPLDIKLMLY